MLRSLFLLLLLPLHGLAQVSPRQADSLRQIAMTSRNSAGQIQAVAALMAHFAADAAPDSVARYGNLLWQLAAPASPAEKSLLLTNTNSHLATAWLRAGKPAQALAAHQSSLVMLTDFAFLEGKTTREVARIQQAIIQVNTQIASLYQQLGELVKADSVYGHLVAAAQVAADTLAWTDALYSRRLLCGQLQEQATASGNTNMATTFGHAKEKAEDQLLTLCKTYLRTEPGNQTLLQYLLEVYITKARVYTEPDSPAPPQTLAPELKALLWQAHQAGLANEQLLLAELSYGKLLNHLGSYAEALALTNQMLPEIASLKRHALEASCRSLRYTASWAQGDYPAAIAEKKAIVEIAGEQAHYAYAAHECEGILKDIMSLPAPTRKALHVERAFFEKKAKEYHRKAVVVGQISEN